MGFGLDLQEGRSYPAPQISYPNDALDDLEDALEHFFAGSGTQADVEQSLKRLEARVSALMECVPAALEAILAQKQVDDDDLPHQIGYLLQRGTQYFNDALELLWQATEGAEVEVVECLFELRTGNDYICHSASLMAQLLESAGIMVEGPLTE